MSQNLLTDRRRLVGGTALSIAGLAALAGAATPAGARGRKAASGSAAQDAQLLNAALALEFEGIAAYQIAAESGLLQPAVLQVGVKFQGHHKGHAEELRRAIVRLGGRPVEAKTTAQYATDLQANTLKSQEDILRFALKLERGAANAYLGLVGPLNNSDLEVLVARLAADEAVHVAVFMQALNEAIPDAPLMFG